MVTADIDYTGSDGGGYKREEAAIAACDRKAIAVFELSAINAATASVKVKLDAKKAELLSKRTVESGKTHVNL